ncbi:MULTISPECIES: hypothetical protein [Bacteroides]|uniref:hypothetical protein n=1 Tax=Bacteroides TaxID=816 RepID=UPI001C3795B2|nr:MULTISPECIES: hypothetical protein [Bacteroides]MBV3656781.1 hypothetical protein [Bacteroides sp. MSK.18.91]MBV3669117.1 hypothetical protein [Bacteroides sp. MSK.18.83]MBV3713571.1 hypothetical protein [Bacteroides sp. MSK.18.39]MBV3740077.1 hypothetical protein [Bacteroides sp. MSK.18.37]MBV3755631.1 hypothetical protein [Bacteroides sp. MSK.18.22]
MLDNACIYVVSQPRAFCRGVCRPEEQTDLTNSRKPHQNSRLLLQRPTRQGCPKGKEKQKSRYRRTKLPWSPLAKYELSYL